MKIEVLTQNRLALNSLEYKALEAKPNLRCGPSYDSSRNIIFNFLLISLFKKREISVLDLGCSGGGFIEDVVGLGGLGVGLEGTEYSLLTQRASWSKIPNNLFVCDIAQPFRVLTNGKPHVFDVVTSWEVLEHLTEEEIDEVCENVTRHLKLLDSLWLMSISTVPGEFHPTIHPQDWWQEFFFRRGFTNDEKAVAYFGEEWIRGPAQAAPGSFHLALRQTEAGELE